MCCASCKVPQFTVVRRTKRTPLVNEEKRPANDVPRDIYGRLLKRTDSQKSVRNNLGGKE
jgi:hypothetical protein